MGITTNLLQSLGRGHTERWSEFVQRYGKRLDRTLRRNGLSLQDREDIVQEILIRVVRYVSGFNRDRLSARGWIKMIREQCVVDFVKKNDSPDRLLSDDDAVKVGDDIEQLIMEDSLKEAKRIAKERATKADWEVFDEAVNKKGGIAGAEKATGKSRKAIYQALSRVRKEIRKELRKMGVIE